MADNSDNEELISVGTETDDSSVDESISKLMALNQPIETMIQSAEALEQQVTITGAALNEAFDDSAVIQIDDAFRNLIDSFRALDDEQQQFNQALRIGQDELQQISQQSQEFIDRENAEWFKLNVIIKDTAQAKADYAAEQINAQTAGDTSIGTPFNKSVPYSEFNFGDQTVGDGDQSDNSADDGSSSGGSGGRGGLSAVGRGFMTAGRQFKSPGLSAVGSGLYEAQGVAQIAKLSSGIGEAVQGTVPALEGLSAGVVGLGAVALVAVPLVIAAAVGWDQLNKSLAPLNQIIEDSKNQIDAYYGVIETGTQKSIAAQVAQAQSQQQDDQSKAKALQSTLDNKFAEEQLTATYGTGSSVIGDFAARLYTGLSGLGAFGGGVKDIQTDLDTTNKSTTDLTGKIQGYNDALDSTQVKLREQTADSINYISQSTSLEQERFRLIQQGSTQAVESQMQSNLALQKTNEDAIAGLLAKYNNTSDPTQQKSYNDEIQKYLDKNVELKNEYEALDNTVLATVYALEQQRKATDGAIAGIDAENQWEMKKADLIKNSTDQQIRDQEDANRRQVEANKNSIAELEQVLAHTTDDTEITKISAKIADYNNQNAELDAHYTDLVKVIQPLVDANDALKASLKDVGTLFTNGGADLQKAADLRTKHDDAESQADAAWNDAQTKADDAFNLKRKQEITTFNDKLAQDDKKNNEKWIDETDKVYADYNTAQQKENETILKYQTDESTKITQINTDLAAKQAQIASDLAAKIGDIQNKAQADELEAASSLDSRRIAQLQRKETQDIKTAQDAAKKSEDAATLAADKQKTQLEKDTATKIEDLKKSDEAAREQRLADGLAKIQEEKDNYATDRRNRIDDFNNKLTDEDGQRQRETDARYTDYQNKKTALDTQFKDAMTQLSDHWAIQNTQTSNHYTTLQGIQTTGQTNIETAWQGMFSKLQSAVTTIGTPTSYTQPAPVNTSNTNTYAPGETADYANYNSGFEDFSGYTGTTGDVGLATGGYVDTATNLSADNKNNNYGDFAGYQGYASGGDPNVDDTVMVGEHGPELARFKDPVHIYDNGSAMGGNTNNGTTNDNSSNSTQTNIYIDGNKVTGGADRDNVRQILLDTIKAL